MSAEKPCHCHAAVWGTNVKVWWCVSVVHTATGCCSLSRNHSTSSMPEYTSIRDVLEVPCRLWDRALRRGARAAVQLYVHSSSCDHKEQGALEGIETGPYIQTEPL